jgi:hypothetical protein
VLGDLVAASDAQVDAAFADEGRDVRGGKEDQCDRQVLDQRDVEAGFAAELDITAGEEVEGCLLQTSFYIEGLRRQSWVLYPCFLFMWVSLLADYESRFGRELALGHGEEETAFQAV